MAEIATIVSSSIGTATLIGVILWFARNLIVTRLANSVKYEFDAKLATIQSQLHSRDAEISAIRETALRASNDRGQAVEARRLRAIEELWDGFQDAKKRSYPMHTLAVLKLDAIGEGIEHGDDKYKQFIAAVNPEPKEMNDDFGNAKATKARLWVSSLAWAHFSAYASMVSYGNAWVITAKAGFNSNRFLDHNGVNQLLRIAIPEHNWPEDQNNSAIFPMAADLLESKLLAALRSAIEGQHVDSEAIKRAKGIVEAANAVSKDVAEGQRKITAESAPQ